MNIPQEVCYALAGLAAAWLLGRRRPAPAEAEELRTILRELLREFLKEPSAERKGS